MINVDNARRASVLNPLRAGSAFVNQLVEYDLRSTTRAREDYMFDVAPESRGNRPRASAHSLRSLAPALGQFPLDSGAMSNM